MTHLQVEKKINVHYNMNNVNNNKNILHIRNYNNIAAKGKNLRTNGYAIYPGVDIIFQGLFFNECVHLAKMYKLNGNGNISTAKRKKVNRVTPQVTPMSAAFRPLTTFNPTPVIPTNFRRSVTAF